MSTRSELLALYLATHYRARLPGGRYTSLRIGTPVPADLCAWAAQDWPLVFITAHNPHSREFPRQENRQRQRELLRKLKARSLRVLPGVGHIPGQAWREPSLLVAGLAIDHADRLAQQHEQNAIVVANDALETRLRLRSRIWGESYDTRNVDQINT